MVTPHWLFIFDCPLFGLYGGSCIDEIFVFDCGSLVLVQNNTINNINVFIIFVTSSC